MDNTEGALFQICVQRACELFATASRDPHAENCDTHYPEIVKLLKKAGVDWEGGQGYEILGVKKELFDALCVAKATCLWNKALRKKGIGISEIMPDPDEEFALWDCLENLCLTGANPNVSESWKPIGITLEDFRKECREAASRIGSYFSFAMTMAELNPAADSVNAAMVWADLYEKMVVGAGEDIGRDDVHKSHGLESIERYHSLRQNAYRLLIRFHFQMAQDSGKDDLERNFALYQTGQRIEEAGFDEGEKQALYAWLGTTREEFEPALAQATAKLIPPPFDEQVPAAPAPSV